MDRFYKQKDKMAISRGSIPQQITKAESKRKWSAKRKSKINCARPRGFSEKAHCASKKGEVVRGEPQKVCPKCKKTRVDVYLLEDNERKILWVKKTHVTTK